MPINYTSKTSYINTLNKIIYNLRDIEKLPIAFIKPMNQLNIM